MATLSCYSLHPLASASSSSTTSLTANHSLPYQPQTKPEIPLLFRCSATSAARPEVIIQPTRLFVQPILLFAGFDKPLDTQTFLATISVLAAIALSLFLGLKVTISSAFLGLAFFLGFVCFGKMISLKKNGACGFGVFWVKVDEWWVCGCS